MSGLFSKPAPQIVQAPAPIAAPTPTPVATLPTVDSDAVRQARQLNQANLLQRGGRQSTILTSAQSRGGDSYSSSKMGSGS
jgi:hypothetical protein